MDYIAVFTEPAIIIGLSIAIFATYLSKLGVFFVSNIALMPKKLLTFLRIKKFKYRRKLITNSKNQSKVTLHIIRTYAFMLVFGALFFAYMFMMLLGPLKGSGSLPSSIQLFICSPMFIFEMLWLLQRSFTQDLIKVCGRYV